MKLIVAGGREFTDWPLVRRTLLRIHESIGIKEVVSGKARGADSLGERFAKEFGIHIEPFPVPDEEWKRYGKRAGHIRNGRMADYGDALVAFWDGSSRGTKNMIDQAYERGLKVLVVRYTAK